MNPVGESTYGNSFSLLDNGVAASSLDEISDCLSDENIAEMLPLVIFTEYKTLPAKPTPPSLDSLNGDLSY